MSTSCVLALDTTAAKGGVAVCSNGILAAERRWDALGSHSTLLMREVSEALRDCSTAWEDITHLAAIVGPGSFTGIRIGLGTIQGLAHALDKPILGITALEALAYSTGSGQSRIGSVIDARRNQVFHQLFDFGVDGLPVPANEPRCDMAADWLRVLPDFPGRYIGSGASLYRSSILALDNRFEVLPEAEYLAGFAARMAAQRILSGIDTGSANVDALYVRPPDVLLSQIRT